MDEPKTGRSRARRIAWIGAALVATLGAWWAWQTWGPPLSLLAARMSDVDRTAVRSEGPDTLHGEPRTVRRVDLVRTGGDTVRLVLSLPDPVPEGALPVLLILGGLEVGEETLEFITRPGPNAYAIYQYPYSPEYWYERARVTQVPVIRDAVLRVPAQVASAVDWLRGRPWADPERISLLGYSFGALLLPASHRVASTVAPPPLPAVLAYGGTDIHMLMDHNLGVDPPWLRSILARIAQIAIRPVEPGLHAPRMEGGPFFLVSGLHDEQIPRASFEALHALVPEPKEVRLLEEGHMHPRRPELTRRLVDLTREWLAERDLYRRGPEGAGP